MFKTLTILIILTFKLIFKELVNMVQMKFLIAWVKMDHFQTLTRIRTSIWIKEAIQENEIKDA